MYDLIIVGGSAAGVAAAIYAARRNLNFILLSEDIGGEVATSGEIENYLGFPQTDGLQLAEKFKDQLNHNQVKYIVPQTVKKISKEDNHFTVSTQTNNQTKDYQSQTVLVATGVHPRELNIPGENEFKGRGVTYCTTCDGPLFKDKITATVGGGNSALESALMMSTIAQQVYLINKNPALKGEQVLIDKVSQTQNIKVIHNAKTTKIFGDKLVQGLVYQDEKGEEHKLSVEAVMVHIGMVPNSELVEVEKNKYGEIIVDNLCRTNTPGLFAAGDVTNIPYKQINIAAGQGTCAALAAIEYLNKLK